MELEPNHLTRMNDNLAMILRTLEAQNELLRRLLTEIEKLGPAEGVGDDDSPTN